MVFKASSLAEKTLKSNPEGATAPPFFENLPELIRPSQIAIALGLSVKTIYDWHYRKHQYKTPKNLFVKFNRSLFLNKSVLNGWINNQNPHLE